MTPFNVDHQMMFPNQRIGRKTECCGITRSLIKSNIFLIPMDGGFDYASDLRLQRVTPTDAGEDPYSGMQADCIYGSLPIANQPDNAGQEQLEMNWSDYTDAQIQFATKYLMKGVKTLNSYSEVLTYIRTTGWGVMLCYDFSSAFLNPNADGSLPLPSGTSSKHCSPAWGMDSRGMTITPLLGYDFGDQGYVYMNETVYNESNVTALAYDLNAYAFVRRAYIALQYPKAIGDVLKVINK